MPVTDLENRSSILEVRLNDLAKLARAHRTPWGRPFPATARYVFAKGSVTAPVFGPANRVIIATYKVPRGLTGLICGLVLGYRGGAGAPMPGDVLYDVDVDNPTAAVVSPANGYTEKDLQDIDEQLGAFVGGPVWPVDLQLSEGETVRIKGQTVINVTTGPGTFLTGALIGWQWPSQGWEG